MRILLTGSTGQLGKAIINSKPEEIDLIIPKEDFDLSQPSACKKIILLEKPDWVINCAAFTKVDDAEDETELSLKIIVMPLKLLLKQLI